MRKLKLLLAACALFGVSAAWAQEDVTSTYLTNAELNSTDGWTVSGSINGSLATDGEVNTIEFYHSWSANAGSAIGNSKDFKLSQTVTLPAGNYRIAVNALYREGNGNGTNTKAYIFAGTKQQYVHAVTSAEQANLGSGSGSYSASKRKDDRGRAAYAFSIGDFSNAFDFDLEEETEITLGFSGYIDTYCSWCILGPVKLYKYSLDDYIVDYDAKYVEADGIKDSPMNADVKSALTAAMVDKATFTLVSQVTAAISTLTTAINNANNSITVYSDINTAITNYAVTAATLDEVGAAAYNASAIQTKYNNGTYETLAEAETELAAALITATKAQTTANSDWTGLIVNPSFESGFTGWTNNGMQTQGNTSFAKTGTYYAEAWEPQGTKSVTQTISSMPAGVYRLTAHAKARGVTSAKIYAAGIDQAITIADSDADYSIEFACDNDADVAIGFEGVGTKAGNSWLCVDNFTLTLVSAGLPDVVAVEGKMNAEVASAQDLAVEAYENNKTAANFNTASAAIAAAQASKDAYTNAATAISIAKDLQTNHNFATATAATTFAEAIAAFETPYTNGTLTTEQGNSASVTLGTAVTGWHSGTNGATVKYMNNGFSLNDFDEALYINTWSKEGETDGSNFKVPFYEYFTGEGNSLEAKTWTGTLTGLKNGLYSVSAWVRVKTMNDETAVNDATGISMNVNGGAPTDVTEGTQIGESRFQLKEYTAEGLVKDGTLNFNMVIDAENNIHWLSFKNVKYTKVRDLTEEEAAVAPTAIALYNGETEVTEPIALNATNNSVTLTVAYTPNNATEGVTWESSDETVAKVANGVVTAVSTGTATITATSTLDANVSASATINVSFTETNVVASTYVNSGATRTIATLGDNLIKNGSFEYPNNFYGWTTGSGVAMSADNFKLITEDDNHYITAKGHTGAGGVNSISTGWTIVAGKTYVFGYKVKSTSAGNSEFHVVSLTNKLGSEDIKVSETSTAVGTEWTDVKYTFTNTDGYAFVQFRARWLNSAVSFDDFYLCEATTTTVGNVDYATAAIPTANIGTGAFQYSQDAIDAVNALVQGTASVEDVQAAYDAVTTINAPADGKLFNIILTYDGWTYDNKAVTFIANDRNDHGNYNIKYVAEANKNLAQAFTFTRVEGNKYMLSQIDADGKVRYVTDTKTAYSGDGKGIRTTTDAEKAAAFTIIPTATNGVYNIYNNVAKEYIGSQDQGFYTVNSHIDFKIVETTKPSITINTTEAGWGTVMLPFAVASLPENVKAYTCAELKENGTTLNLVEVDALEANKPYIIEGAWNESVSGDAQGTALTYKEGLLTGIYAATQVPVGSYILQNQNDVVAFYNVVESQQPTLGANHAYLTVPAPTREALYFGGDATGIMAIDALTSGNATIFNAAGAQIPALQKGMNIVRKANGKSYKVIVK